VSLDSSPSDQGGSWVLGFVVPISWDSNRKLLWPLFPRNHSAPCRCLASEGPARNPGRDIPISVLDQEGSWVSLDSSSPLVGIQTENYSGPFSAGRGEGDPQDRVRGAAQDPGRTSRSGVGSGRIMGVLNCFFRFSQRV
jgi:hypothetical protein